MNVRQENTGNKEVSALSRLFGRDMEAGGWTIKMKNLKPARGRTGSAAERRREGSPDPAMIWALRGRRR